MGRGLFGAAAQRKRPPEVVLRVERAGVRLHRAPELRDRFRDAPRLQQDSSEVVARRGVVGGEAHGLAQVGQRFRERALEDERAAEVVPRAWMVRLRPDRPLVFGDRGVEVARRLQGRAQVVVDGGAVGPGT
jgi:hypothetical protein